MAQHLRWKGRKCSQPHGGLGLRRRVAPPWRGRVWQAAHWGNSGLVCSLSLDTWQSGHFPGGGRADGLWGRTVDVLTMISSTEPGAQAWGWGPWMEFRHGVWCAGSGVRWGNPREGLWGDGRQRAPCSLAIWKVREWSSVSKDCEEKGKEACSQSQTWGNNERVVSGWMEEIVARSWCARAWYGREGAIHRAEDNLSDLTHPQGQVLTQIPLSFCGASLCPQYFWNLGYIWIWGQALSPWNYMGQYIHEESGVSYYMH